MSGMNKDNTSSVIDFSDRTYGAVKYYFDDKNKRKSNAENDYYFYENILGILRSNMDEQKLNFQIVDGKSYINYNDTKIFISPGYSAKNCVDKEFVYRTCRYAGNNCTTTPPTNDQYTNFYHLFEMLKYVYLQREIYLATDNSIIGTYFSKIIYYITEKDFTNSKKFTKLTSEEQDYLSYIRYANLNAARFLCELFKTDKVNSFNGCFQLLSYILYTEYLLDGYVKKDIIGRKVDTNPIHETLKLMGTTDSLLLNANVSNYEKVTHGFALDNETLDFIKSNSFDNYRGTFVNRYYETEAVLKKK